ncbi:MAG: tRNA lysidine(34) synthetase TilS [Alphaproteobacteria bacterium]
MAVAVSGGRDSMALALLADAWARALGGSVLALTVDHGLRPEAADEARRVAAWLTSRGIPHRILRGGMPSAAAGLQAAARALRYRLLEEACRAAGALHLLLAHQRDDQAETVLLRREDGSGPDGLAGMASLRETRDLRVLRPLLRFPRARLAATLAAMGQQWIDDPSNVDRRFARARLRAELDGAAREALLAAAAAAAADRAAAERRTAADAAGCAVVADAGYVLLDPAGLARAADAGERVVRGALRAVGGASYPPRSVRLGRLMAAIAAGLPRPRTLAGCRIVAWRGSVMVCREPAAVGEAATFDAQGRARWDDRFDVAVAPPAPPGWRVAALGRRRAAGAAGVPGPARPSLPAVWDGDTIVAVPIGAVLIGGGAGGPGPAAATAVFAPRQALAAGPFAVV